MDEYHFEIHPTAPGKPLKISDEAIYHRKVTLRRLNDGAVAIVYTHLTGDELENMNEVVRGRLERILRKWLWEDLPAEFDLDSPMLQEHRCQWHP